jgi:hypothetical protein
LTCNSRHLRVQLGHLLADKDLFSERLIAAPQNETIELPFKRVLYKQDATILHVYFPCAGALSLTKTMEDGGTAEVATIGNEGMIGASVFFGDSDLGDEEGLQSQSRSDPQSK